MCAVWKSLLQAFTKGQIVEILLYILRCQTCSVKLQKAIYHRALALRLKTVSLFQILSWRLSVILLAKFESRIIETIMYTSNCASEKEL